MTWQETLNLHRQEMVAHFIWLRGLEADYARQSLSNYLLAPNCPCPDITVDIRQAWEKQKSASPG